MIRIRNGRVTGVGARRPGATELQVRIDDKAGEVDAISYDALTGPVAAGDRVVLNTTAVALGLGTGGFHVVMARLGGPVDAPGPGHVIKARYTPSQVRVLAVEEEDSPHRAAARAEYSEIASRSPPKACPAVIVPATSPPERSRAASREKARGRAPPSVIT